MLRIIQCSSGLGVFEASKLKGVMKSYQFNPFPTTDDPWRTLKMQALQVQTGSRDTWHILVTCQFARMPFRGKCALCREIKQHQAA